MLKKSASNHRSGPQIAKDSLSAEWVFMRLGSILAEIADAAAQGEIKNDAERQMSPGQAPAPGALTAGDERSKSHQST